MSVRYWLKTTNNCYVSRKHLYSKPDITYLDNCGPIPMLELEKHFNQNGTSDINKRDATPATVPSAQLETRAAHYLINVTVGEEYASCHTCTASTCPIETTYEFNQEVYIQCVEMVEEPFAYWSLTTEWCWVENSNFWESPEGDCESDSFIS